LSRVVLLVLVDLDGVTTTDYSRPTIYASSVFSLEKRGKRVAGTRQGNLGREREGGGDVMKLPAWSLLAFAQRNDGFGWGVHV
jgi:hypothetical protein